MIEIMLMFVLALVVYNSSLWESGAGKVVLGKPLSLDGYIGETNEL
jgi:hypothetical protein